MVILARGHSLCLMVPDLKFGVIFEVFTNFLHIFQTKFLNFCIIILYFRRTIVETGIIFPKLASTPPYELHKRWLLDILIVIF